MKSEMRTGQQKSGRRVVYLVAFFIAVAGAFFFGYSAPAFAEPVQPEQAAEGVPAEDPCINEWEARVIDRAGKTFKYEGRVYYAYGEYMQELQDYLSDKGTDLSEQEAKDAIAQIEDPENAKAGAQSGYLYQVGGKPAAEDSLSADSDYDGKLYPEFDPEVRFRNSSEYRKSELFNNNKQYIENQSNYVYESQEAMRQEMREIAAADRNYAEILRTRGDGSGLTELKVRPAGGILFTAAEAIMAIIVILLILWNIRGNTIPLLRGGDDEGWNRGNSRHARQKIRKVSSIVLIIIAGLNLTVAFTGITYHATAGSEPYIENAVDEGGICEHGFIQFREDTHGFLAEKTIPQNSLDLAMTFRDYRFDYMKGIRSAMRNGEKKNDYRGVQEAVEAQIDLMAYLTKQDSKQIVQGVNERYEGSMSNEIGLFVHKIREGIRKNCLIGYILALISLLAAAVMLLIERHSVYRGLRDLAYGAAAGTGLWACLTAYAAFGLNAGSYCFEDDSVYVMFQNAVSGLVPIMLVLLVVSAVITLMLLAAGIFMGRRTY